MTRTIRRETVVRRSTLDGRRVEVSCLVIACACGEEVLCDRFTNACACGRDYNGSGSLLADRSQWGEETGETVSDILSVDSEWGW